MNILEVRFLSLCLSGSAAQRGLWLPRPRGFRDRTQRRSTVGRVISPSQRPLPDNTQYTQKTNLHAPVGFEPTIAVGDRPSYALNRAATGTGT
jgi:hypothetical protein